jgi:integrase
LIADRVEDLVELHISEHASKKRSAREISRLLRREVISNWGNRSVHEIGKRDIIKLVHDVAARGAPSAANKLLKVIKTFFGWCLGRAIIEASPAQGLSSPARETARDRVLTDAELTSVLTAARQMNGPYGAIIELLALTGQRREEVAQLRWEELDLTNRIWTIPAARTKNAKPHMVHLSKQALAVLMRLPRLGSFVFSVSGAAPFQSFSRFKRELDQRSSVFNWRLHDLRRTCVSGMARLGVPPHVADKVLNHQGGTISGVAAVYQRHEFLSERKEALDCWGAHVGALLKNQAQLLVASHGQAA